MKHYVDLFEAAHAHQLLQRPTGEAYGHTTTSEVPALKEHYEADPNVLPDGHSWFFPALAYCLVGVDKSLFELCTWNTQVQMRVKTYQAAKPIAKFNGVDVTRNRWFYTIQGIPLDQHDVFAAFASSMIFRKPGRSWGLALEVHRIADPYSGRGIDCTFLLPYTTVKKVEVTTPAGLLLSTPTLAMTLL